MNNFRHPKLDPDSRLWRLSLTGVASLGVLLLIGFGPAGLNRLPGHDLSQALFGLPCPFCGMTRGSHALLEGDWRRALYFNPAAALVLPVMAGTFLIWLVEGVSGKQLIPTGVLARWGVRTWKWIVFGLFVFWGLHVWLALRTPKMELLRPQAPFYPTFWQVPGE